MNKQQLPYWVLSEAIAELKKAEVLAQKNLNQEWITRIGSMSIQELMSSGAQCCGDRYARLVTVRRFIEEALYEQEDELNRSLEEANELKRR